MPFYYLNDEPPITNHNVIAMMIDARVYETTTRLRQQEWASPYKFY